jgi:hypothetical protein
MFYVMSGNCGHALFRDVPSYQTRRVTSDLLRLPKSYTTCFQKSFVFLGPKFFNNIPLEIKRTQNRLVFKTKVLGWLRGLMPDYLETLFNVVS